MWRIPSFLRGRTKDRQASARRSRRLRLFCEPLEDRFLLTGPGVALNGPAEALVGTPGTWTATSTSLGSTPVYQFSVEQGNGPYQVVQDFSTSNTFVWNPIQQGNYNVKVIAKDSYTETNSASIVSTSEGYTADSRVTGGSAVVSSMSNPLVALFSAPPINDPSATSMYVQYSQDGANWLNTSSQAIVSGESTNFIVAGMLPNTTYYMRYVTNDGTVSSSKQFTTGSLPGSLTFPTVTEPTPAGPNTDMTDNMILHMGIGGATPNGNVTLFATNLAGNINWYYDPVAHNFDGYAQTLVPGGTILMEGGQVTKVAGQGGQYKVREMDLAGDVLHETNVDAVNAQLAVLGQQPIIDFNHEDLRLPNGDTAVLATTQRVINVNGTPTTYNGQMVLVLDQNFQVKWVWDPFNWLSTSDLSPLGEGPADWMHANALAWSPTDGNLLVSIRSLDSVVKINYSNGTGDGHIVWTLGKGRDFTIDSSDPSPWFTHQHNVYYINDNTIVVFDDGNTRRASNPNADSRGQEYILNEQTKQATLVVNADLGNYSLALGSAQVLSNGNLDFDSGFLSGNGQSIEVSPNGVINYVQQSTGIQYRSYFMSTLYGGDRNEQGLQDVGFEKPSLGTGASAYQQDPTGSQWSFTGAAGLAGNGSNPTSGNSNAPQGSQVAFLQGGTGSISQTAVNMAPGTYQINLSAAQAARNGTASEAINVEVDGTVVGTITPTSTTYAAYSTPTFQLKAGNHTITFVGLGTTGGTALLDQVDISPVVTGNVSFVERDTWTQGNWKGVLGSDGYNVIGNSSSYPSYAQVSAVGYKSYVWSNPSTDPRALQDANDSQRIAATWFSNSVFTINVNMTDGQTHQLALYMVDWDNKGRKEEIDLTDAETGTLLSAQTVTNFGNGEYLIWNVSGDINVQVKYLGSKQPANAVLSGIFLDPQGTLPLAPPPATAHFVTTDTSTQGNWKNVYGSDGYNVIDNAASYPSYARVNAAGYNNYVWSTTTSDVRALQDASGQGRTAATWFTNSTFSVNVNMTDGNTHQLALYLLDWDNKGRREEIDILDAATGNVISTQTASNFGNGEYLVWNVSGNIVVQVKYLGSTKPANAVLSGLFLDP